jgi:PTS system mannose-specific IIA component
MFEIIIVSHGNYAEAMLRSAEMIVGRQEGIQTFGLHPGDDVDALKEQLRREIARVRESGDALVLTDMMSGSPFNAAVSAMSDLTFSHVTGVNLPMLLEICGARDFLSAEEVGKTIVDQGRSTIVDVNELMKEVGQ